MLLRTTARATDCWPRVTSIVKVPRAGSLLADSSGTGSRFTVREHGVANNSKSL
jgi:hypothetical protein